MRHPTWLHGMLTVTAVTDVHRGRLFEMRLTAIMSSPGPVWNSEKRRSPSLHLKHGTGCKQNSSWCVPRQLSSAPWKHSSSGMPTVIKRSNQSGQYHRSICRRRTKSTVDLIWFWQRTQLTDERLKHSQDEVNKPKPTWSDCKSPSNFVDLWDVTDQQRRLCYFVYTRTTCCPATCVPDEQLVSGYIYVDGHMLPDTSCSFGIHAIILAT